MSTYNVTAMKLLGSMVGEPFFQFQNQAIATIYDPPYLLKCTRNLFYKYDVQFESEHSDSQLPVIVKWEHIVKIYEQQKRLLSRSMYKLTDDHLKPASQYAMKLSFNAQVMSHTVYHKTFTQYSTFMFNIHALQRCIVVI
jgi:hypothetical protein